MLGKIPVPWRQVYSYYCSWVVYHLNCLHNIRLCILPVLKRRFVNSKMFSAGSWHVSILGHGVCALRLVCLQDTTFLKNAKDGQEHVHAFDNNLKSLVIHSGIPKLGYIAAATRDCAPSVQVCRKIIRAKCTVVNLELGAKNT